MKVTPIRLSIASATISVLALTGATAAPQSTDAAMIARSAAAAAPMSVPALEALYSGKTWKWNDGGGYFSADRHRFTAWSEKGDAWSYGKGRWRASYGGKVCIQARWHYQTGYGNNSVCFLHREKDGVIYQKRALGGDWYVFRHNPGRRDDEARKLVPGDRVGKDLARLEAER